MKTVLLSQRVDILASRGERRDAVDQRLVAWLAACGYLAVPVPNQPELVAAYWDRLRPHAVVLSGGNDLASLGGDAPERDRTEQELLRLALASGRPLFALCRGMQLLLDSFGVSLERVEGHVATRHDLLLDGIPHQVNSFHSWGAREVNEAFVVRARSADGVVEAVRHVHLPLCGVMWHPEREAEFNALDSQLLVNTFG